jgi:hypothetical protein
MAKHVNRIGRGFDLRWFRTIDNLELKLTHVRGDFFDFQDTNFLCFSRHFVTS